jgi:TonB family protein
MTQRLREVEPALVVISVGGSGDQQGLISLLAAGLVDRLMIKPVTSSLAQIVLRSAVQQRRTLQGSSTAVTLLEPQNPQAEPAVVLVELQRHAAANDMGETKLHPQPSPAEIVVPASTVAPSGTSGRIALPRPAWIAVAALLAVAGLLGWVAAERQPAIDPQAVIANNLAAARRAFHEGHALEPRGRSALDYYTTVLALDPANVAARQGIDQIADRFAAQAGVAIARGQIAAAIVALDGMRRVSPEHRQLRELQEQLAVAQETFAAKVPDPEPTSQAAPKAASAPPANPAAQQKLEAQARAVAEAAEALKRDQLKLANAQQQFALKIEAAEAQLAAARKDGADVAEAPPPAAPVAAAPEPPSLRLARIVRPDYPQDALIRGAEGWVNVSMSVTPAGNVLDPRVEESSNGKLFNRAALAAVRKWKYEPFAAASPQDTQRVTVRVDFRIEGR